MFGPVVAGGVRWPGRKPTRWWRAIQDCRFWTGNECEKGRSLAGCGCGPDAQFACPDFKCEDVLPYTTQTLDDYRPIRSEGTYDEEWGFEISAIQNGAHFRIEQGFAQLILSLREMISLRERCGEAVRDTNLMRGRAKKRGGS